MQRKFRDLPIGAVFVGPEFWDNADGSGSVSKPGTVRRVKVSPRGHKPLGSNERPELVPGFGAYLVVFQPRLQPGPFGPLMGLRVWIDEYKRLSGELEIYRDYANARATARRNAHTVDTNYPDWLHHELDCAAARVVAYGEQLANELLMTTTHD